MIEGPRAAIGTELPGVIALSNAVFNPEAKGDMGAAFPTLFHPDNLHNLRICLDSGRPVSLVGVAVRDIELGGARLRAACIGSVCTLEPYRGRGLAGRLMDDAIAAALAQGAVIILVSGGRGLYRRMGCIDAGLFRTVKVEAGSRFPAMRLAVREWAPADVGGMAALQRTEPVRWLRGEEETRLLLATNRIYARPGGTWVVHAEGKLAAWFSASDPDRENDGAGPAVREIAGSRLAALAALPAVLGRRKLPYANVVAVASDLELELQASVFGLHAEIRGFHGTVKIIDPPGLFRSLDGWIAERLGPIEKGRLQVEHGAGTTFRHGGQSLALGGVEDLAALVFGSVERALPLLPPGPLSEVLRRIFPVPLPCYGLSYI